MTGRNGICEFKSLAKSVELDTEWFKSVTSALPKFATQGGGSIVSFVNPYSDTPEKEAPISDSVYPCTLCGMVTPSRSRHVLNSCERLRDKYRWRKENLIHYIDSILDHNTFKAFCNLKDRRTTRGGTIPIEIQPITGDLIDWKELVPDFVAIDRLSEEVFIFVITCPHESDMEDCHTEQLNKYHQGLAAMRRSFKCTVNFYALEIGSASGYISTRSANALYELHKLTTKPPLQNFIHNVSQLAKLGSYRIYKGRLEGSKKDLPYLYPDIGGRVFSTTRRTILNKYIYPLARAGGCIVAIIFLIFLLYLLCLLLLWIWSLLTKQLLVFVFFGLVFLCLLVFRP